MKSGCLLFLVVLSYLLITKTFQIPGIYKHYGDSYDEMWTLDIDVNHRRHLEMLCGSCESSGYLTDENIFILVSSSDCASPGLRYCDTLTFECTVVGGFGTVWRGSAFDCENSNNEITLLHSRFVNGAIGTCNNDSIIGRSIGDENGTCFTSQLSVTITPDTIGKTIECFHDDYEHVNSTTVVGSFTISPIIITAPPETLYISHIDIGLIQLTFSWNPVAPDHIIDYPGFDYMYNILASNCGSCPTTTNHTNVTCTDIPTNGSTCTLAVETVVCTEDTECTTGIENHSISIRLLNTRSSHNTREHSSTDHDTMLIASIIFLVVSLFTCTSVSMTVIVTVLMKNRVRIEAIFNSIWWKNRASSTTAVNLEGMYDDVIDSSRPSLRMSVISTTPNVAYGQKQN